MIKIGNKTVGTNRPPYFIADIAANHNGSLEQAYKLIELAKESGADAAKFQNFTAEKIVSDQGFKANGAQLAHQATWEKTVYEVYDDASLPPDWTSRLKAKCDEVGIEYMTSPYDFANVDLAEPYVNAYKIGSGDITWYDMLQYIADKGKPVLLATGASTMDEVDIAVSFFQQRQLVLMQCNTDYTASRKNYTYINLNVLKTYAQKYPEAVLGISDHTHGHTTVLGAIALGARVIEKHFTEDNAQVGPDHAFSMTPEAFRAMVDASMDLYRALGDGVKRVEENEQQTVIVQRRGLYFTRDISANTIVESKDLAALRPALVNGYAACEQARLIGKTLSRDVQRGAPVLQQDFT